MKKKLAPVTAQECVWESGELGVSREHARPASDEHQKALDEHVGLQMISIRLQKNLIDGLKIIAEKEGVGYQPLIRRVLVRFVDSEFKRMVQDMVLEQKQNRLMEEHDEEPRRCAQG